MGTGWPGRPAGHSPSIGERPTPQLFLCDLPQTRQTQRLEDQESDDHQPEDDLFDMLLQVDRHCYADSGRRIGQEDRQHRYEKGAEE